MDSGVVVVPVEVELNDLLIRVGHRLRVPRPAPVSAVEMAEVAKPLLHHHSVAQGGKLFPSPRKPRSTKYALH